MMNTKFLLVLLAATLAIAVAQADDSIPFVSTEKDQVPYANGTINGKVATQTRMGKIDVHSVIPGLATSYDQAEAMCRAFKAGNVTWSLPNLLTIYEISIAGPGATVKATVSDEDSQSGTQMVWVQGSTNGDKNDLRGSRKILMLGSSFRTELVDLNEAEAEFKILIQKVPAKDRPRAEAAMKRLAAGFPVVCVSKLSKD